MGKFTMKGLWQVLKQAAGGFSRHKIPKLSASLAYYTIFSLGPMMIVIIYLVDLVWGRQAVEGTLFSQISVLVGDQAAMQIQEIIKNASLTNKSNLPAIIGIVTLVIGATTVFAEIQDSINTIWNLRAKMEKGWLKMIINRLLSFSLVISLSFLLLVSLVLNGLMDGFMRKLQEMFPQIAVMTIYAVNNILTLLIVSMLFAIIFKVLPDAVIRWKDVGVGAVFTAVLFMIGKFGITLYIGKSNVGTTYGAAGSLIIILLWVYFSAFILYFGAEFTKAYAFHFGSAIKPNEYAVAIKIESRESSNSVLNETTEGES